MRFFLPFPFFRFFIFFLFSFSFSFPTFSKEEKNSSFVMISNQASLIAKIAKNLETVQKKLEETSNNDETLLEQRASLELTEKELLQIGVSLRPMMNRINAEIARIDSFSEEEKKNNQQEIAERSALLKEKQKINDLIDSAGNILVQVKDLNDQISILRRKLFSIMLFKRYEPRTAFNLEAVSEAAKETLNLFKAISAQLSFLFHFRIEAILATTFFSFFVGFIFHQGMRFILNRLVYKYSPESQFCSVQLLSVVFWSTILPFATFFVIIQCLMWLYAHYNLVQDSIVDCFNAFLKTLFTSFFIFCFSRSLFSPHESRWRLIPIEPRVSYKLIFLSSFSSLIIGLDDVMSMMSMIMDSPLSVTVLRSLIASLLIGLMIGLFACIRPFRDKEGHLIGWPAWFKIIVLLVSLIIIVLGLIGYVRLAKFISSQIIVTGAYLATAYFALLVSRAITEEGNFGRIFIGKWLRTRYDMSSSRLDQIGLLFSVIFNILILIIFVPLVLFQWGFKAADIQFWLHKIVNGFEIGSVSFSPLTLISGAIVFFICYTLTRSFQRWINGTVLARSQVDEGVRESIETVIGYVGIAIACILSVSAAGLNLSNLAIIAGGLSLGIGFGLQNIVSNFVSGLILLFERPFKPGDWVTTGDFSGIVKKIRIRATEINTLQNQSIIIPNSQIINNAVGNWTHQSKSGRLDIPVCVIQSSNVRDVHDVLMEVASSNTHILKNPKPFIAFSEFANNGYGETIFSFEVRIFVPDISSSSGIKNDICFSIIETFKQKGIKMPGAL